MMNYINQQLTASCSKLPNVFLVGHENLFAYGSDVLHDDRHIKKRHIGLFATNLINAVRGTDACPSSKKYIYAQSATAYGKIHVIQQRDTKQQSYRRLFSQQTPPAEYQEKRSPFLREKREQGQRSERYNDAIPNELISF